MCLNAHDRDLHYISRLAAAGQLHLMVSWLTMVTWTCCLLNEEACDTNML